MVSLGFRNAEVKQVAPLQIKEIFLTEPQA
jgi:hypothetical protein